MQDRPDFVSTLLSRPLPPLTPPKLGDKRNPPYSQDVQSKIADLKCHPLLESALHLMNDDLFSAHFLLRKMQEDEWGKWLHAILHQTEGDLEKNAKLWYQQVEPSVLSVYWGKFDSADPCRAAVDNMYKIMRVKAGDGDASLEEETRKVKWDEICCAMEELEKKFGWKEVEGTGVYTKDKDPGHKSMILGEGYRKWDKSGWSDR